ncbi:MAG: PEP-CTERM sorting domain-containing protein [Aromatoleum sp.]|nr:PEP-CTERM sorting domain-containing protein [Aromatoleum sp.]
MPRIVPAGVRTAMKSRTRELFVCAVIAASLAGVSTLAQGRIYPITFDPQFDGPVFISIDELVCNGIGTQSCNVDLVSADVFDTSNPLIRYTGGPTSGVGDQAFFTALGVFNQFQSVLPQIIVTHTFCDGDFCFADSATLEFFINDESSGAFPGFARLTLNNGQTILEDHYVVGPALGTAVPEPGTLALLFGALGAGWLAKRRKFTI